MRKFLLLICVLLTGASGAWAQLTVTCGSQVTTEDALESGKAYIVQQRIRTDQYVYLTDDGSQIPSNSNTAMANSLFYFISDGSGKWMIRNVNNNRYWGVPATTQDPSYANSRLTSVSDEENAGHWSLNFSNGLSFPSAISSDGSTIRGIDRAGDFLLGWGDGTSTGNCAALRIYEVASSYYTTLESDLQGKVVTVGDAVSSFTTDTWYAIKCNTPESGGYYRGSIFETPGALYHNGNTTMDKSVKYLFRFESAGEADKYYVKTAYGNYWTDFTHETQIGTRTPINGKEKITIAKINNTDGHFYFQSEKLGVVMDANGLGSGVASGSVVGWNDTAPSATGGNNDWGIYEVSITDFAPTASEIYTLNNTNPDRGALMYAPAVGGSKWVWVGGLNGAASFDANNTQFQWIFYPTGTNGQYYLYNVRYQKFIVPVTGGVYSGYSWAFSSDAVPVSLAAQSDGTYKIYSSTGSKYISVSTAYTGPVIDYNDTGAQFTLTKVADASDAVTTQLTAAVGKLIDSQDNLTEAISSDGWYAFRVQASTLDPSFAGNYLYTLDNKYNDIYALGHISDISLRPAINDAKYYFYVRKSGSYYYIKLPNGQSLAYDNGFPASNASGSTVDIQYRDGGYFRFVSSGRYADAYSNNFVGETGTADRTKYDIYPIDLEDAGLTAWSVTINGIITTLTCTRDDISGLSTVYNNGYFFLPTGVTPSASDFSGTGLTVEVDAENKVITAYHYQNLITAYMTDNDITAIINAGERIGYPDKSTVASKAFVNAYAAIMLGNYTAETYEEIQSTFAAYTAQTAINLPEEGKTYTISMPSKRTGETLFFEDNDGTIELVTDATLTDSKKFICHIKDGKFMFAMPNGNYLIWRGNTDGENSNKGEIGLSSYNLSTYPLTIEKFTAGGNFETNKGKVEVIGKRNNNTSHFIMTTSSSTVDEVTTYSYTFNQAGSTNIYWADDHTSAVVITEVSDYYNKVNLTSDGEDAYASLYLPFSVTIPSGITAYAVTSQNGTTAHMEPIVTDGTLPKETAVILKKDGQTTGESIYLSPAEEAGSFDGTNMLAGTVETTTRESLGSGTTYVLGNQAEGLGLYTYTGTNLAKGKAYLFVGGEAPVKALTFDFGNTTGIDELIPASALSKSEIYNLAGQRMSKMQRGVNIVNGKKVIIK